MIASWDICHVDLSDKGSLVAASLRPVFVMFWWRGLPLGVRTYLPEQLPLQGRELTTLAAELASTQLAARLPRFGGPARATFDGRPLVSVAVDAVRACGDVLEQLDDLAETSQMSAHDLTVVICTRDRREALARCLVSLSAQHSQPGQIIVVDAEDDPETGELGLTFKGIEGFEPPPVELAEAGPSET